MKSFRVFLTCGLLFLISVGLWGQTAQVFYGQVNDVIQKTRFMIGPLRFYPYFKFSSFSWVSSVFGLTDTLRNISDLVIAPSPELTAYLVFKRSLILSFTENPEYYFYLSNAKYRGFTNAYRAEARWLFLNRFIITGRYENQTQRTLGYVELDRVVQYSTRGVAARVQSQTARPTSLLLEASWRKLRYSDVGFSEGQISPELNHDEFSAGAELGYRLFSAVQFFLRGRYSEYKFLSQTNVRRNPKATEAMMGFNLPSGGLIGGTFSLGYKRFLSETQSIPGFSGLVGNADLRYRMENLGILQVSFRRDVSFSMVPGYLYFLDTTLNGAAIFRTTAFLFFRVGGSYSWLIYPRETPLLEFGTPQDPSAVRDHLAVGQAGFIIRLSPTFGLGLTYQKWFRDSPLIGRDFNGSLVTVDIVREF